MFASLFSFPAISIAKATCNSKVQGTLLMESVWSASQDTEQVYKQWRYVDVLNFVWTVELSQGWVLNCLHKGACARVHPHSDIQARPLDNEFI